MESVKSIEDRIEQTADKIMEAITNKDEETLFNLFSPDIQGNRKSATLSEIQQALDFIDGKIVSYDYHRDGGGERSQNYGNIDYYYRHLRFTNVTTDTSNMYTISVEYFYIWDDRPEREGISFITISKSDDRENNDEIGQIYYDY